MLSDWLRVGASAPVTATSAHAPVGDADAELEELHCDHATLRSLVCSHARLRRADAALRAHTFPLLTHLNIAFNQLTSLPPLRDVAPSLRSLDVSHNHFEECAFAAGCTSLTTLLLHANRIRGLANVGACTRSLPALELLSVYDNPCSAQAALPSKDEVLSHAHMRLHKIRAATQAFLSEAAAAGIGATQADLALLYLAARSGGKLRRIILTGPSTSGMTRMFRKTAPIADGGSGVLVSPLMVAAAVSDITHSFMQAAQAWSITPFASVYAEKVGEPPSTPAWLDAFRAPPRRAGDGGAPQAAAEPPTAGERSSGDERAKSAGRATPARARTKVIHDASRPRKRAAVTLRPEDAAAAARARARAAAKAYSNSVHARAKQLLQRSRAPGKAASVDAEHVAEEAARVSKRMQLRGGTRLSTSVAIEPFPEQLSITPLAEHARSSSSLRDGQADSPSGDAAAPASAVEYEKAPGEIDPQKAAECEDGYHVTFSGRVMAHSDGSGSQSVDGQSGVVALRVRPDGTATCRWPTGTIAMDVTIDDRAVAALQRYNEAMQTWKSSGLVSSYSTRRHSAAPGDAAPVDAEDDRAYRIVGRSFEVAHNPATAWVSVLMDGFGIGAVTSNDGATLLSFHDDASGFHADNRGLLLRRWNASGEITYISPHFVEDDPAALYSEPAIEGGPAPGSRPNSAPSSRASSPKAPVRPSKSNVDPLAAAAAVKAALHSQRRSKPPTDDVVALRQAVLTDLFSEQDDETLGQLALRTAHRTHFVTATACAFILGKHMAVLYDLVVHQLKLYLACDAFRYELVVASATGSSLQEEPPEASAADGTDSMPVEA